jgi:uncharacterized membrane protein YcaP (DUF421 family)
MKKEDIHLSDWYRILFGEAPVNFLFEVGLRTIFIYLVLLIVIRLLGKRMGGEITITETAVMITLGAIISAPMQIPDRGLVQGVVILLCALVFQKGFNYLTVSKSSVERLIYGKEIAVVKDGVLQLENLEKEHISRQQLYAFLRSRGILHLGELERVYMEAGGFFTVYKFEEPQSGLPILPPKDKGVSAVVEKTELKHACEVCGMVSMEKDNNCISCGSSEWVEAVDLR